MTDLSSTIPELVLPAVARQAARDFAAALAETPQFKAFEQAAEELQRDQVAQRAIADYTLKQQSLQWMQQLNAVSAQDQAELERLHKAFLGNPTVAAYLKAQEALTTLCQAAGDLLSRQIGLSFAAACGPGCC